VNQLALVRLGVQQVLVPPTPANPTQLVRSVQGSLSDGWAVSCSAAPSAITNADFVKSTGYISTTGGSTHSVTVCTTATARRVDIMPTSFAPNGVVQVTLQSASLLCGSTGSGSTAPTATWTATVKYWSYAAGAYVTLNVSNGTTSPLTAALLTKGPGGVDVGRDPLGGVLWLGDYISSWTSGSQAGGATTGTTRQADLTALAITTAPTRDADTVGRSSLNLAFGQLSCLAQDNR
jgi:hypothetical protein